MTRVGGDSGGVVRGPLPGSPEGPEGKASTRKFEPLHHGREAERAARLGSERADYTEKLGTGAGAWPDDVTKLVNDMDGFMKNLIARYNKGEKISSEDMVKLLIYDKALKTEWGKPGYSDAQKTYLAQAEGYISKALDLFVSSRSAVPPHDPDLLALATLVGQAVGSMASG